MIRRKNGKAIAGIPQLGLFAKADEVNAALAALDAKKKAFVADLKEAGELGRLEIADRPAPTRRVATIRPASNLGQFALKAGIVVCVVVAVFRLLWRSDCVEGQTTDREHREQRQEHQDWRFRVLDADGGRARSHGAPRQ